MTRAGETSEPADSAEVEARLRKIGEGLDEEIDLAETGLLLAAYRRPDLDFARYRHHLSLLVRDTADMGHKLAAEDSLAARAEALRAVVAERYGYTGDRETYDDLQNADLARVIDRRMGLPVALGLLYVHTAERQGWEAAGINFPGHFLIRLRLGGEATILDPFNGGIERDARDLRALLKAAAGPEAELDSGHTSAVARRDLLLRLQNNIKLRLLAAGRTGEALAALETMVLLAPGIASLWREAGTLHGELGNLRAAMTSLQHSLQLGLAPGAAAEATALLQRYRGSLH